MQGGWFSFKGLTRRAYRLEIKRYRVAAKYSTANESTSEVSSSTGIPPIRLQDSEGTTERSFYFTIQVFAMR